MEPTSGPRGPEIGMAPTYSPETTAPKTPESIEVSAPAAQETAPASREAANQNSGMTLPQVVQDPPTVTPQPIASQQQPNDDASHTNSPALASDVDVIEKEWVNKAKVIIHQTRDDPHAQEQEVSKLQADYLKKRYGKVIKPSQG